MTPASNLFPLSITLSTASCSSGLLVCIAIVSVMTLYQTTISTHLYIVLSDVANVHNPPGFYVSYLDRVGG